MSELRARAPTEVHVQEGLPAPRIGRLVAWPVAGRPEVEVPGHGAHPARVLKSVGQTEFAGAVAGCEVLLVFVDGDPTQPVIVGLLDDPLGSLLAGEGAARDERVQVTLDGRTVTLEAAEEITLRCGEASLTLFADGRVVTRGVNIVSHASEQQRIQGAVVKIN